MIPTHGQRHERRVRAAGRAPEDDGDGAGDDRRADAAAEPGEEARGPFDARRHAVGHPAGDVVVDRDHLTATHERLCEQEEDEDADSDEYRLDDETGP